MATLENNVRVSEVSKAANFARKVGCVLKNAGKGVIIVIAILAMTFIFFNPLFFVPYTLLAPRKAAESLYDWDLEVYMDMMQALYGPFVAILPFHWKKHFMAVRGICEYSAKWQIKYFYATKDCEKIEVLKKMDQSARRLLWNEGNDENRKMIAEAGLKLDAEQIKYLLENSYNETVKKYVEKNTPSEAMLRIMLKLEKGDLFLFCVEHYGLSAEIVREVFQLRNMMARNDFRVEIAGLTEDALAKYAQRQMVRNTAADSNSDGNGMWTLFLKKGNELCTEAQKMMNIWQYDEYHKCGLNLSTAAIVHFLAKGNITMCERIFKYEPSESLNSEASALVAANPSLLNAALKIKNAVAS